MTNGLLEDIGKPPFRVLYISDNTLLPESRNNSGQSPLLPSCSAGITIDYDLDDKKEKKMKNRITEWKFQKNAGFKIGVQFAYTFFGDEKLESIPLSS